MRQNLPLDKDASRLKISDDGHCVVVGYFASPPSALKLEIRLRFGCGGQKSKVLLRVSSNHRFGFTAHFDSRATMLADNPKVENLTTSDGFLIAD